jgi:tetratricopeptide (TPR) repeat protein
LEHLNEPAYSDEALVQIRLSFALSRDGKIKESIEPAEKAYEIACRCDGEFSPLTSEALLALGIAYESNGNHWTSIRELSKACRIWSACLEDISKPSSMPEQYVTAITWSADAFLAVDDYDRAARCLQEARKLVTECVPINDRGLHKVLSDECWLLDSEGHHKEALARAEELLEFAQRSFHADSEEVLNAKATKAEMLLKLSEIEKADALMDEVLAVKLKDNPARQVPASYLTDVYAEVLVAKHQYPEATAVLDPRLHELGKEIGPEFSWTRDLLQPYATALHHVGRDEDAARIERQHSELLAKLKELHHQIDADPECKFPWEK